MTNRATDRRQQLLHFQQSHHSAAFSQRVEDGSVEIWFDESSPSVYFQWAQMRDTRAFFDALPARRMLTVGDGKGALEARFVQKSGHQVLATDLCTEVLAEAQRRGLIPEFAKADAEQLPFDDESFDYVVVKETLHHLQRPYLAIYEALRVAREGVMLVEPSYQQRPGIGRATLAAAFRQLRRCLVRRPRHEDEPIPKPAYEECGNYIFEFHPYELCQTALGLGLNQVAYGYAHHYWDFGLLELKGDALQARIDQIEREFARQDKRRGLTARRQLVFFFFKQPPPESALQALRDHQFHVAELEANPRLIRKAA